MRYSFSTLTNANPAKRRILSGKLKTDNEMMLSNRKTESQEVSPARASSNNRAILSSERMRLLLELSAAQTNLLEWAERIERQMMQRQKHGQPLRLEPYFTYNPQLIRATSLVGQESARDRFLPMARDFPEVRPVSNPSHVSFKRKCLNEESLYQRDAKRFKQQLLKPEQSWKMEIVTAVCVQIPMAVETDRSKLSKYQALLRESLEYFTADEKDSMTTKQGRRQKIRLGQIGVRCKYCSHLPHGERQKGAVNFPKGLKSLYQAAQNVATAHFLCGEEGSCRLIPAEVRADLEKEKNRQLPSSVGKPYWEKECLKQGFMEEDEGLWLRKSFCPQA